MRSHARRGLAALAALALAATAALAQEKKEPRDPRDARLEALEKRVEEQAKEIEALKRAAEKPAPPPPPPSATPPDEKEGAPSFEWAYDEGFFVKGRLGGETYRLRPRVGLQVDYRAFPHAIPDDRFLMRRAAVGFEGEFSKFDFVLMAQPLRSGIPLVDAFIQFRPLDELKVRAGHFKTPFSLDNGMLGDFRTDLVERPMVLGSGDAVAPDFHPGGEVLGSFGEGLFQYWVSAQNQVDSNTVLTGDPLLCARLESDVGPFSIGAAGAWDRRGGAPQLSFAGLTPGQLQFFAPVSIRGWGQRYEIDLAFYRGPFFVHAELVWAQQERRRVLAEGVDGTPLVTQGAYVTIGWEFFGPPAGLRGTPRGLLEGWELFSFDIERRRNKRNEGADLHVRLEWVDIDDARGGRRIDPATDAAAAPSTAKNAAKVRGNGAWAVTVGAGFRPIDNVVLIADWVHLRIGDQARAEKRSSRFSDEILLRAQLDF